MLKLLLVEDDRLVRITVRDALREAGYRVTDCADGTSALRALSAEAFDVLLTDVRLPGIDGLGLLRRLRELQSETAVLLMTAYANTDDAVSAMRDGAQDYITKPFEIDELLLRLGRVRQDLELKRCLAGGGGNCGEPHRICGTSSAIRQLHKRIAAAAATDANVLICGETGTGKDLCARAIHAAGARAARPFVAVNCAALPDTLLEAELFGHERGAFTGAERRRAGRFEAAAGGTLFLDEIGDLSPGGQAKLLRAIETSTFEPLGSSRSISVDVRIIAATHRDLGKEAERVGFRRDLYYRLNVIDIRVPPLRERRSDIPALVRQFLDEIAARGGRPPHLLHPRAMAALATFDYPGNVRQLIHALERAAAMAHDSDVIHLYHLPPDIAARGSDEDAGAAEGEGPGDDPAHDGITPLDRAVHDFEAQYIRYVLERVGGHRGRAAALLGISRKALWQRLRDDEEPES